MMLCRPVRHPQKHAPPQSSAAGHMPAVQAQFSRTSAGVRKFTTCSVGDATTWAEQYNAGAEDWLNEYGREMGDAAAAEQVCCMGWMACLSATTLVLQPNNNKVRTVFVHAALFQQICFMIELFFVSLFADPSAAAADEAARIRIRNRESVPRRP